MKIICVDNYDREDRSDQLVCENVNEFYGKIIVMKLNKMVGDDSSDYFKLVADDHKLYKFEGY